MRRSLARRQDRAACRRCALRMRLGNQARILVLASIHAQVNTIGSFLPGAVKHSRELQFTASVIGRLTAAGFSGNQTTNCSCKSMKTQANRGLFPRALAFSPERTVGQTTCPEELPARAEKVRGEIIYAAPACCPGAACKGPAFSPGRG